MQALTSGLTRAVMSNGYRFLGLNSLQSIFKGGVFFYAAILHNASVGWSGSKTVLLKERVNFNVLVLLLRQNPCMDHFYLLFCKYVMHAKLV